MHQSSKHMGSSSAAAKSLGDDNDFPKVARLLVFLPACIAINICVCRSLYQQEPSSEIIHSFDVKAKRENAFILT